MIRKINTFILLVIFSFVRPAGAQDIAAESFNAAPQTLHQFAGGSGWFQPWYSQNAYTGPDGYSIADANPMVHPENPSPGSYAQGGGDNTASGRYLNPPAFSDYLDVNGRIGAGTMYLSFLIRKEEDTDAPIEVILADAVGQAWQVNEELIKMGYFGTTSNVGADRYWSLSAFNETAVDLTDTVVQIGETYQIIVEIDFGAITTINMWVNPENGIPDLLLPDATVSSAQDLGFWNLVLYFEGAGTGHGSFDEFIFSSSLNTVLPVEYLSISARQEKGKVVIDWSTTTESNNDHFKVQTSSDGENWIVIGSVNGHGNSNSIIDYQFTDRHPIRGHPYYRLVQVDFDGTESFSQIIIPQSRPQEHVQVTVSHSREEVAFFSANEIEEIFIYNLRGQLVLYDAPHAQSSRVRTDQLSEQVYQFILFTPVGTWNQKIRVK